MPRRRSRRLLAFIVAVALFGLTACGGSDSSSGAGGDGTITIGVGSEPLQLDPQQTNAGADSYFILNVYERLIGRDTDGKQVPQLATKWDVADGGKTITFTLREGVKFHDGSDMTSEDVKYSFERSQSKELKNPFAAMSGGWSSIDTPDPEHVVFHFDQPRGAFLASGGFTYIVSKSYMEKNGQDALLTKPNGTGPLKFVDRNIGEGYTLARFDKYWGTKAAYKAWDFRVMTDTNARMSALQSGQIQIAEGVPAEQVSIIKNNPDLQVKPTVLGDNVYLRFSSTSGNNPWDKPEVRQALAYAVDQESIIKNVLGGYGIPIALTSPLNDAFATTKVKQYPYDVAKAKQLLAQAGYPDGFNMDFVSLVNGRVANSEQYSQAVMGYWEKIGVKSNLQILPYAQWQDKNAKQSFNGVNFMLYGDSQTFDPEFRFSNTLSCDGSFSSMCDPAMTDLLAQLTVTVDPAERNAVGKSVV